MIQNNYFSDNIDLFRHFEEIIDWDEIVNLYENGFKDAEYYNQSGDERFAYAPSSVDEAKEYYRTILDAYGNLSGKLVAANVGKLDQMGLKYNDGKVEYPQLFIDIVNKFHEAGLAPITLTRKYGGLSLPNMVRALISEIANRADIALATQIGSIALTEIIEKHADDKQKDKWLPDIAACKYFAAMGLTEPDYGSDLPGVNTKAELKDGRWVLNGVKRFITIGCGMGDRPCLILTLARTGGAGAKGLSFFLVNSNDTHIGNIEKKMGQHCSPTCEVVMENTPGELVGKEGYGLIKYVIGMLDGARLNIASQSTGLATAAWEEAKSYASTRIQFGKPLNQIPAITKMLEHMEREILAMRCLVLESARAMDLYEWRMTRAEEGESLSPDEKEKQKHWKKMAGMLTPLSKYYNSEMCNRIAGDALQIHGGSGYTEDYDIARIYRDARVTTIYDGTTQIQINAAIGGVVAGLSPTGYFRKYLDEIFAKSSLSKELQELYTLLEEVVREYKESITGEDKERMSFEVVESAVRLINGILLERTAQIMKEDVRDERLTHAAAYNTDSYAIIAGNLHKLKARGKISAQSQVG